ncbi:MAG: class I SAM-dependent methyltransferase [Bacteroidota bacterium]
MARIAYDRIKDQLARSVRRHPILRRGLYLILDVLFLRSWYLRREIRRWIRARKESSFHVLDAGSGFGQYDRFLLEATPSVEIVAVDVKEEYLLDAASYMRSSGYGDRIQYQEIDLLELEMENEFDLILSIDVLEHIEEDREVLRRLYRALRPGGTLMVHSPSHFSIRDAGDEESFVDEHARTGYSDSDLREKLMSAGFSVEKIGYSYGFWGHLAWVWTVKWPMLWLTRLGVPVLPLLFPWYLLTILPAMVLNRIDLHWPNREGTGIYSVAQRKGRSKITDSEKSESNSPQ